MWGSSTFPLACRPCGGLRAERLWEAVPLGVAFHRCEGHLVQALSLPRLPVPWGGLPGFRDAWFPGAVGVGVGTQQRPHGVRSCEPSLHAVGVAEGRPLTYDFSSCFFPKFKKSAKRGSSRETTQFFGFCGPKIGGGDPPTRVLFKNIKNPDIWPILGYFCLLWAGLAEQCCTLVYLPIEDFRQKFPFSLDSLAPK